MPAWQPPQQYTEPHPTQYLNQTPMHYAPQHYAPQHSAPQQYVPQHSLPGISLDNSTIPAESAPTQQPTTSSVPQQFKELSPPEINDAMDAFPSESRTEPTEELPAPVRSQPGEQPLPTDIPEAARIPAGHDNAFPILLSPTESIEPPQAQGVIYHPMPEVITPAPVPDTIGGAAIVYPRTDASGPTDWIQFRESQR